MRAWPRFSSLFYATAPPKLYLQSMTLRGPSFWDIHQEDEDYETWAYSSTEIYNPEIPVS